MNEIEQFVKIIQKTINPLRHRVNNLVRLGKVLLVKDGKTQSIQILSANHEVVENVKFIETYGLTAKPLSGSETVVFNIQGNPGNNVVLNIGNREIRFKELKNGEVCVYDNSGNRIWLQNGGNITITAPGKVSINTATAEIKADKALVEAENIILSGTTSLGGSGGQPIARVGDAVSVDPQTHQGTILAGSTKVSAL